MLLEAVTAIGLVGLLLAGVYAGIRLNEDMLQHTVSQRQALDVLDNVVERLAAEAGPARLAVVKVDATQPGGLAEDALGVAKGSPLPAFRFYKGIRSVGALAGYKPALLKEEVAKLVG